MLAQHVDKALAWKGIIRVKPTAGARTPLMASLSGHHVTQEMAAESPVQTSVQESSFLSLPAKFSYHRMSVVSPTSQEALPVPLKQGGATSVPVVLSSHAGSCVMHDLMQVVRHTTLIQGVRHARSHAGRASHDP